MELPFDADETNVFLNSHDFESRWSFLRSSFLQLKVGFRQATSRLAVCFFVTHSKLKSWYYSHLSFITGGAGDSGKPNTDDNDEDDDGVPGA